MFKTRVTEMLGIEYPIIQGAMANLSGAELVSAVANAGGLGIIASLRYPTTKELREEIKKTKSMTDKPFAVNVSLLPTIRPVNCEEYFTAAIEEGVNIIEAGGPGLEQYIKLLKDAKVKVMYKVGSSRHAKTAERIGADIVTIVNFEAASHSLPDGAAGLVLVPACVDAVKIPVIAAGGIADARGFVAALALGAEGVLMGTRFMTTKECNMHPKVKEWLLQLGETDTLFIQRSIKSASRVGKTEHAQRILEMEEKGATLEELQPLISGDRASNAYATGDVSGASISVGQAVGLIHDIPSVKELIDGIISEAKLIMQRLRNVGIEG